jgi:predicted nucleotidyltransferase
MELLKKYAGWKIIETFLENPSAEFYGREIASKLKMSTFTASRTLKELEKEGFLEKEEKGKAIYYSLSSKPSISALKKYYALWKIQKMRMVKYFLKADEDLISLAIFGSYSSGEYDAKSDLDIICITEKNEKEFIDVIRKIERILGIEVNTKFYPPTAWRIISTENRLFYETVVRNYTLLYGTPLVIE